MLCEVCLFRSVCFPVLTLGVSGMCSFGFRPLSSGFQAERLRLLAGIHEHVPPKSHIRRERHEPGEGMPGGARASSESEYIHHTSDLPQLSRIRVWDKDRNTNRASNADFSWER